MESNKFKEQPETNQLAKKWGDRISKARKHWEKFHKRVKHNRKLVSGLDWSKEPDDSQFYMHRANLIQSTIAATLPNIYAKNPEISVIPLRSDRDVKLLCKTIQTVTNRQLEDARLKPRAKATVRAALTCSFGAVKVMYQRDLNRDPIIQARIQDAQDNIARVNGLLSQIEDEQSRAEEEAKLAELHETIAGLEERAEVVTAEGLVIDRILTENILIDPSVAEFEDYIDSDWIMQIAPMKRTTAESLYGYKLDKATKYKDAQSNSSRLFGGRNESQNDDEQICIVEIWDKQSQTVYTMAEGCDFWLREPYRPKKTGERWYPFFLLPFNTIDGQFIAPSLVDLTERLQEEHNQARDRFNQHRDLIKPGYIASADVNEKTLRRFSDSELGEITLVDTEGKPLNQMVMPRVYPPIDPAVYDTTQARYDWEQVTGLQDAARSTMVQPKTATEASIMERSLSGRVSEFIDKVEDYVQEIAQYSAELLLQELDELQVEKIMGSHKFAETQHPLLLEPIQVITEQSYEWPSLTKNEVFDLVQLKIRAGTAGEPNRLDQQETWVKILQVIQPLISQIMQLQAQGVDTSALQALLKETVTRFDDKLDIEELMPNIKPMMPQSQAQQQMMGGM